MLDETLDIVNPCQAGFRRFEECSGQVASLIEIVARRRHASKKLEVIGEKARSGIIMKNRMHVVPCLRFTVSDGMGRSIDFRRTCFSLGKSQGFMYTGDSNGNLEHATRWLRYFFAFVGAVQEELDLREGNPFSFRNVAFASGIHDSSWGGLVRQLMDIVGIRHDAMNRDEQKKASYALDTTLQHRKLHGEKTVIREELRVIASFYRAMAGHCLDQGSTLSSTDTAESVRNRFKVFPSRLLHRMTSFLRDNTENPDIWTAFLPVARAPMYETSHLSPGYLKVCTRHSFLEWDRQVRIRGLEESLRVADSSQNALGHLLYMLPSFHMLRDETLGDAITPWRGFRWGILGLAYCVDTPVVANDERPPKAGPPVPSEQSSRGVLVVTDP